MEHTPKNLLIRAVKQQKHGFSKEKWEQYERMAEILGCDITLGKLLKEKDV